MPKKYTSSAFRKSDTIFNFHNNNTNITTNNNNILHDNNNDEDEDEDDRDSGRDSYSPKLCPFSRTTKPSVNNLFRVFNPIEEYPINNKLKLLVNNYPSKENSKPKASLLSLFMFAINTNYFLLNSKDFSVTEQYFFNTKEVD
jgi:hypothetical protein